MRVGLVDVDGSNFPNLPLMKLSAWHKSCGDQVEWYSPMFSGHMDKVYVSKFFHSRLITWIASMQMKSYLVDRDIALRMWRARKYIIQKKTFICQEKQNTFIRIMVFIQNL